MLIDNTLTIAISGTTSTAVDLGRITNPVLFLFPATTNTSFDIQGSTDNVNFHTVYERTGTKLSLSTASGGFIYLEPEAGISLPQYMRLIGSSGEASGRVIKVFSRDLA